MALNDARWALFILARATQVQPQTNPLNPLMRYITAMTSVRLFTMPLNTIRSLLIAFAYLQGIPGAGSEQGHIKVGDFSLLSVFTLYTRDTCIHTTLFCLFVFAQEVFVSMWATKGQLFTHAYHKKSINIFFPFCLFVVHVMGIIITFYLCTHP